MKFIKTYLTFLILLLAILVQTGAIGYLQPDLLVEKEIEETIDEENELSSSDEISYNSKSNGGAGLVSQVVTVTGRHFSSLTQTLLKSHESNRTRIPSFILFCCLKLDC